MCHWSEMGPLIQSLGYNLMIFNGNGLKWFWRRDACLIALFEKAYNDQDKLKYNIDVKFGHIILIKRSLQCNNSIQEWYIMIDPNSSMVVNFTFLCYY